MVAANDEANVLRLFGVPEPLINRCFAFEYRAEVGRAELSLHLHSVDPMGPPEGAQAGPVDPGAGT